MTIQRFCYGFCLGFFLATTGSQSTFAETFSFRLNGLGESDALDGDRTIHGSMTLDGDQMPESQTFDFDLRHDEGGDGDDQQSLGMVIRNQGESILEAVFDIFGLTSSRSEGGSFDANISGDINPTDSELDVTFGEDLPGMRIKIKTPQVPKN